MKENRRKDNGRTSGGSRLPYATCCRDTCKLGKMTEAGKSHATKCHHQCPSSTYKGRAEVFSYFLPKFSPPHFLVLSLLFSSLLVNLTVKLQITFLAKLTIGRLPLNRLRAIEIAEMTSYLSRLSLMPGFPEYTGPHKVGTIDVELPVSDLDCPSPSPDESISTVQYRIFYPCQPDAKGKKNVNWLPAPQRGYISAYTKFLGAGSMLAELIS